MDVLSVDVSILGFFDQRYLTRFHLCKYSLDNAYLIWEALANK